VRQILANKGSKKPGELNIQRSCQMNHDAMKESDSGDLIVGERKLVVHVRHGRQINPTNSNVELYQ
jgi:hypothetical protein